MHGTSGKRIKKHHYQYERHGRIFKAKKLPSIILKVHVKIRLLEYSISFQNENDVKIDNYCWQRYGEIEHLTYINWNKFS